MRGILLALLLCLISGTAAALSFEMDAVPDACAGACEKRGSIERIEYETCAYEKNRKPGRAGTNEAYVYLPYGYDPAGAYDVLYLLHGSGGDASYWFDHEETRNLLDNLIESKACAPLIVVTPCLKDEKNKGKNGIGTWKHELKNDLIPAVEGRYATFAHGDTSPEGQQKSRAHRAFAGLSLGSAAGWASVLTDCLDVIGWVGNFSGCYANAYAAADGVNRATPEYPIAYWYNGNGSADSSLKEHRKAYQTMLKSCPKALHEGENCCFIEKPGKKHSFESWIVDLYNVLNVFFPES